MRKITMLLFCFIAIQASAQETLQAMFYNVFKFPNALPNNREIILRDILDEYQPDLFMVCELASEAGADLILNTALQNQEDVFARAAFVPDLTDPADPLQTMVFYNTRKLTLASQQKLPTVYRDINQYSFVLNTDTAEPIHLEVFVAHLKSSTGTANQQKRLQMVEVVTNQLANLTQPNTFVLFSGDFNLYKSSEPAFQKILSLDNAIKMVDPLNAPGNWQDNLSFSYLHTQSTRVQNTGFGGGANAGAGGGLDDRFDFIMMSDNFHTNSRFTYVDGSYKAYGNNGNCMNMDVKDENCTGEFSQTLRNNLYYMSDHLPVVMQFQINEGFLSTPHHTKKPVMWFESSNMSSDYITIGFDGNNIKPGSKLYIFNTLGQQIDTFVMPTHATLTLPVFKYAKGMYFVRTDVADTALKFVKK